MPPHAPAPSARLVRAAVAEREALRRHRAQLVARRDELRAELDGIDAALREVDERDALIERLTAAVTPAADAAHAGPLAGHRSPSDPVPLPGASSCGAPLRGPAIRAAAVRVLLDHPEHPQALHYRDWFAELERAGHTVAGKEPLAVFLTQLSRSPAIRKSTRSGVYELDRGAPGRLRARLEELHRELRDLSSTRERTADLVALRRRRAEINVEITRTEKALEEAQAVLRPAPSDPPAPVAIGDGRAAEARA